jgi:hypothetical protein
MWLQCDKTKIIWNRALTSAFRPALNHGIAPGTVPASMSLANARLQACNDEADAHRASAA